MHARELFYTLFSRSSAFSRFKKLILFCSLVYSASTTAFDNDYSINRPDLNAENFLDINSVQFNEEQNEQWNRSANGWRITGHSLTSNLLYTGSEVKLMKPLNDVIKIYFNYEQELFYADKPLSDPLLEIEYQPFDRALSFSIISSVNYNKAESDIGFGITFGNRDSSYIHIQELIVDRLFNQKNEGTALQPASYSSFQHIWSIEAAFKWSSQFEIRLNIQDLSTLAFNFNDSTDSFTHGGYEYEGSFRYRPDKDQAWKLALKGFQTDKSLATTGSHQVQQLDYESIDLSWLMRQTRPYQFSLGIRRDKLANHISDAIESDNNLDYSFSTNQLYSTVQHRFQQHNSWNIGLYLGRTRKFNEPYQANTSPNENSLQSQLRTSWIFSSKDNNSSLQLHLSINLDSLPDDPGDGAGMSYQSVF
jgi:hypothetical protein